VVALKELDRLLAVFDGVHAEVMTLEGDNEELARVGIVVGNEETWPMTVLRRRWFFHREVRCEGSDQHRRLDRLGEEIGEAGGEAVRFRRGRLETGEREDRDSGRTGKGSESTDKLDTVDIRQQQVLEDEIRDLPGHFRQRRFTGGSLSHAVSLGGKRHSNHLARDRIVVDNEDGRDGHLRHGQVLTEQAR